MKNNFFVFLVAIVIISLASCSKHPDINIEDYLPEEVIPPEKIFLKSIIVNDLPDTSLVTENAFDYDGTPPDIYMKIFAPDGISFLTTDIIWEAHLDSVHTFLLDSFVEIAEHELEYSWDLLDKDLIVGSDYIVGGRITFFDGKETPDTIYVGGPAKVEFVVEYEF